jgi:hypothetical protein
MCSVFTGSSNHGMSVSSMLPDEEKSQLNTKIKIEGTVDKRVFDDFKEIMEKELVKAREEDRVEPNVSNVLEMLLRKGIRAYKAQRK